MKARSWRSRLGAPVVAMMAVAAGGAALVATGESPAGAATFTVTTTADSGAGSLRAAVVAASASPDASDTITVSPSLAGQTITLTTGELFFHGGGTAALSIAGNGVIVHQATTNARVFDDDSSGLLSLDMMTISGGNLTSAPANGAAVLAANSLTITNSEITANTATSTATDATAADIIHMGATTVDVLTLTADNIHDNTATGTGVGVANGIFWSYTTDVTSSTIADNTAQATGSGGAIGIFDSNDTTLTGSTVTNNQVLSNTGSADGVFDTSDLTVSGSTVSGNTNSSAAGDAEGVLWPNTLTVTDSAVTNNTNHTDSGTAYGISRSETATITRSTVSGNTNSTGSGTAFGGINAGTSGATVVSSTIADNISSGTTSMGGAIYQGSISIGSTAQDTGNSHVPHSGAGPAAVTIPLTVVYSTIVDNAAATGANIDSDATQKTAFGSVVALPRTGANCALTGAAMVSDGYNFSDDATCGFTNTSTGDQQNAGDPQLTALGDNGGPGPTRLPGATSPLFDAIPIAACQTGPASGITTDERGVSRPQFQGCDIGAVEVQGAKLQVTKVVTGTNGNTVPSTGYSFAVKCSDGTTGTLTVADATKGGTSGTVDGIVPGSTCTVTESAVTYTNATVVGQPAVTFVPATPAPLGGDQTATVTVTNDYSQVNLLGEAVVQPKFTG